MTVCRVARCERPTDAGLCFLHREFDAAAIRLCLVVGCDRPPTLNDLYCHMHLSVVMRRANKWKYERVEPVPLCRCDGPLPDWTGACEGCLQLVVTWAHLSVAERFAQLWPDLWDRALANAPKPGWMQ